jgi:hypothetical protein
MDKYILIGKKPVIEPDLYKWAKWYESAIRSVKKTEIGHCTVSTVFLGMNYGYGYDLVLFETMVFGNGFDDYLQRYETWDQAEKGHEEAVLFVTKILQNG